MIEVSEFSPSQEVCTASMYQTMPTGESYSGPIHVGYYPDTTELWIDHEGARINIEAANLPAIIKQLKRAAKLAATKEANP